MRAFAAEEFLRGKECNKKNVGEFTDLAMDQLNPRDSWRASKEFRVHMMREMTKRSAERAVERLGGKING